MAKRNESPVAPREDEQATRQLMRMMAIPGRSGQERRITEFLRKELVRAGARTEWMEHDRAHAKSPIGGEVGNLVLKLPGTVRGPRRLLLAHERHSDQTFIRMWNALLDAGQPGIEVLHAYVIKERLRSLLSLPTSADRELITHRLYQFYAQAAASQVDALEDPTLTGSTNEFFNDAPTGQILADRAEAVPFIAHKGPKFADINTAFQQAIQRVDEGQESADEAWDSFLADVERLG